ncbi:MAG: DUF6320 domain-containing protein, partial [Oscillospiraceae bacterium]
MKTCPACKIKVGGEHRYCPLCQNELLGENSELYFPRPDKLKQLSIIYKIQIFISFVAGVVCLVLDCLLGLNGGVHWSMLTTAGIIVAQFVTWRLFRKRSGVYYYIANICAGVMVLLLPTAWLFGIWDFIFVFILPSLFLGAIGSLFAFTLVDKEGDVLPYLLSYIVVGAVAPIVLMVRQQEV